MRRRLMAPTIRTALVLLIFGALAGCSDGSGDTLAVGDDAPGFTLPDASGSTVSLSDYGGQPALLYFHMADG